MSTITSPFTGSVDFLGKASLELGLLSRSFKKAYSWKEIDPKTGLLFLESSSPNFVVS